MNKHCLLILLTLFCVSGQAATLSAPTSTKKLLHACSILAENRLNTAEKLFQAGSCQGMLSSYIALRVSSPTGSPGWTIKGFLKVARQVTRDKSASDDNWDYYSPNVLIEESLKAAGAVPCKESRLKGKLCVRTNFIF
jgi:hypothetical protein